MSRHTRRLAVTPPAYARGLDSAFDTFTDVDGTSLLDHKPDGGGRWIQHVRANGAVSLYSVIDSNHFRNFNDANARPTYHSARPQAADYEVSLDVILKSDNNASNGGPAARMNTLSVDMYLVRYLTNGNLWQLDRFLNGSSVALATVAQNLTIDQVYRCTLRCSGSTISVLVDSVEIMSVVNTEITDRGRAGFRVGSASGATVGLHFDNFQATALAD